MQLGYGVFYVKVDDGIYEEGFLDFFVLLTTW